MRDCGRLQLFSDLGLIPSLKPTESCFPRLYEMDLDSLDGVVVQEYVKQDLEDPGSNPLPR